MKLLSDIAKGFLPPVSEGKIVEFIAVLGGWRKLETPTLSTELQCLICGGTDHYPVHCCPINDLRRVWICGNGSCASNKVKKGDQATTTPPKSQRAILWPLFCEINGIGDLYHDVKFEDVQQSEGKISYMLKFADKPSGILFMQGDPGTGKTYASMAICELFTRRNREAIFCTQKQMFHSWLDTFKPEYCSEYVAKVKAIPLLVIDDFGTAEISPGFMSFFMDLINTRMQWSNRGTVITTNLDDKKFGLFCGDALVDRINTGQLFEFKGKTRRISTPL
jgi:hypothetical protein